MQKSLTQVNMQIHHVLSEITGVTGLAIQPAGHFLQIRGEGREDPHRIFITIPRHGDINLTGADVDSRGVGLRQRTVLQEPPAPLNDNSGLRIDEKP
jgi:hypothetical protein